MALFVVGRRNDPVVHDGAPDGADESQPVGFAISHGAGVSGTVAEN